MHNTALERGQWSGRWPVTEAGGSRRCRAEPRLLVIYTILTAAAVQTTDKVPLKTPLFAPQVCYKYFPALFHDVSLLNLKR